MDKNKEKVDKLYKEFEKIYKSGNKDKIKEFLKENFSKYPKNIQNKIIYIFFTESLNKKVLQNRNKIGRIKEEGIIVLKKMEQLRSRVQEKIKTLDIRERLKKGN